MPSKNPSNAIRTAYFNLLNDMVIDGITIPCYDTFVPQAATKPYIILRNIFYNDGPKVKDNYLYSLGIRIEIQTQDLNEVGYSFADDICDEIVRSVMPLHGQPSLDLSPHYACIFVTIGQIDQQEMDEENKYLYTKTIIFNHLIEQKIENN